MIVTKHNVTNFKDIFSEEFWIWLWPVLEYQAHFYLTAYSFLSNSLKLWWSSTLTFFLGFQSENVFFCFWSLLICLVNSISIQIRLKSLKLLQHQGKYVLVLCACGGYSQLAHTLLNNRLRVASGSLIPWSVLEL